VKAILAWPSLSLTTLTGTPSFKQQGAVGVAQVVEADDRYAGAAGDPLEGLGEGVGVDRLAVAVGEHPCGVVDADRGELGGPECLPSGEYRERGVIEVDGAAGVAGLASRLVELVADGDESPVERDGLLREVDVVPPEPEDLVAAHPGHRRQPQQREEPVSGPAARRNCCNCSAVQDWASASGWP